jgi:hypothetical protein
LGRGDVGLLLGIGGLSGPVSGGLGRGDVGLLLGIGGLSGPVIGGLLGRIGGLGLGGLGIGGVCLRLAW